MNMFEFCEALARTAEKISPNSPYNNDKNVKL
jgi:hypothetical protein